MGSWDCYCAICGGPFGGGQVAEKPRSARFLRRQRNQDAEHNETEDGEGASDEDDDDDVPSSIDSWQEDHSYDPDIISEGDIEWTDTLHILGFNAEASGLSKAFVSGPGTYSDYGGVDVEAGNDPNFKDFLFSCYHDFDQGDPVFPFHWCCYELLCKALTGSNDVFQIDKDLLFNVMQELAPDYTSRLDLDYGKPGPENEQFWVSEPGMEFLVAHPTAETGHTARWKTMILDSDFNILAYSHDLGPRVKYDPFAKLPYDLIHKICCLLPVKSLLDLGRASWPVQSVLRNNDKFWKGRIKSLLPWFSELHELINDPEVLQKRSAKALFIWADKVSTAKVGMKGPFMGLANRRRIWGVCEQLARLYLPRLRESDGSRPGSIEHMIQKRSACVNMPVVSFPVASRRDLERAYFVRSWADLNALEHVLEIFWDANGSLVGISLSPDTQRRLFGKDDTHEGVSKESVDLEKGDWISGFILHLPIMNLTRRGNKDNCPPKATSIKGITILQRSGQETHFGETDAGHSKRPLLVSGGLTIVGVMGQIGPDNQLIRLGLLQTERPELDDYSFFPEDAPIEIPQPPTLQSWLWKDDYRNILSSPIWAHPNLRLASGEISRSRNNSDVHAETVPYEAIIWAKDRQELQNLKRLSAYVVIGGLVSGWEDGAAYTRPYHDVCGIRADFNTDYNAERRLIGRQKEIDGSDWFEQNSVHFDIDGQGGEHVVAITVAMHEAPKAIKLRTNRGREIYWGEEKVSNWQPLPVPAGETICGLVMTFAISSGYIPETRGYSHMKMSSVAALTLPL